MLLIGPGDRMAGICNTYVCEIIIEHRCATFCHTGCILIGWTYEEVIADRLAHLILILEAIADALPIRVLFVMEHWKTLNLYILEKC